MSEYLDGQDALTKAFARLMPQYDAALAQGLTAAAIVVEGTAVELSRPADTGMLSKSITHQLINTAEGKDAVVFTNTEYAPFVEFGTGDFVAGGKKGGWHYKTPDGEWHFTHGMKGRFFMTNGLLKNKKNIKALITKALSKVAK